MLSAKDIRGLYAIIPTPAKPGANRLDAKNTVDLDESERLVKALIKDGVSGLIALGTTGECATLSRSDYDAFVGCILETVNRRIPTFIGASALGGHEVASRLSFVRELGADGTLLGLPMWQPMTTAMVLDYYRQVSDHFGDLALMVYANARAFRYAFPLDFWETVAKQAKTVVTAKYSRPKGLKELIAATRGQINFMPNEMAVAEFYAASPETTTACWATAAAMGPAPAIAIMNAILRKDQAAIKAIDADVAWASEPVKPIVDDPEVFASYNIQMEKIRINAAGYCNCGPTRSPYDHMPDDYATAARECGTRWSTLVPKYATQIAKASASA
jgi:dihydrodipicolinate synthase/N-acetylneuraminate lyase